MYASLNYIQTRAPYGEIPEQPSQHPDAKKEEAGGAKPNGHASKDGDKDKDGPGRRDTDSPPPETRVVFDASLRDLARNLIYKEQQIEIIVNSLPGIGNSEAEQEQRIVHLQKELKEMEAVRAKKEAEREEMVDLLGDIIGKVKRVP
jgi:mediator of RNA polymerase II transcription subunit 21